MDNFFGILLVIIFLLIVMRPMLQRWLGPVLQRWMLGKMEDRMRRMAGMPTRKEERKAQRRRRKGADDFRRAARGRRAGSERRGNGTYGGHVSDLQVYAEDVEFTEVKAYSDDVEIGVSKTTVKEKVIIEEQIEDADFEDIK